MSNSHSSHEELMLIQLSQHGDEKAFAELIRHYEPLLKQQCYKLNIDEVSTNDIIQDILINVFKKIKYFEGRSKFSTWLYRIARNTALNHLRKTSRIKEHFYIDEMLVENIETKERAENLKIKEDENLHLIDEALQKLPEKHRLVFKMYYYEKIPQKEIAERLNLKEGTVRSRLHYARKKIKDLWALS